MTRGLRVFSFVVFIFIKKNTLVRDSAFHFFGHHMKLTEFRYEIVNLFANGMFSNVTYEESLKLFPVDIY